MSSTPFSSLSNFFPLTFWLVIKAKKSTATISFNIVKAVKHHANGKPDFVPLGQTYMYIELVESTATLEHIPCCVHDKWGETTYYIFTADGLALEESAATQGLLNF